MRTANKNKQSLKYAQFLAKYPRYDTDDDWNLIVEYTTDEGIPIYRMIEDDIIDYYSDTKDMKVNIAESGGEAEAMAFGLSIGDYEAVLLYKRGRYPLKEGTRIWVTSPVEYEYNGQEVEVEFDNGEKAKTKVPDKTSADYYVIKIANSINYTRAVLKAVEK